MNARAGPRLLFAVTAHGLGHLTRSLAIARELQLLHPALELVVSTALPEPRVALDLPRPFVFRAADYEPGLVQRSCLDGDPERTRLAYRRFLSERAARLDAEVRSLRGSGCIGVVSDIPALPICAAARLALPAVGISNFTWDWILEPVFAAHDPSVPERLAADYAQGSLHLRLPFGPARSPFPRSEAAPLVCRRASLSRVEVCRRLGIPRDDGRRLVLVGFGGLSAAGLPSIHVTGCDGLRFVSVGDLPVSADAPLLRLPHALPEGVRFPDLVAAADVALAKPGYGIASECAAHRTPLVAVERPDFREAPVLIEAFGRIGPICELSREAFFAGRWEQALRTALASEQPWAEVTPHGARRVARRIAAACGLGPLDPV